MSKYLINCYLITRQLLIFSLQPPLQSKQLRIIAEHISVAMDARC
jgi:hypothetical protein